MASANYWRVFSPTQCDKGHAEDLCARPEQHRQQHPLPRGTEDVAVHQLPTKLFLRVFSRVNLITHPIKRGVCHVAIVTLFEKTIPYLVVPGNVLVQSPQHDHGNHARKEEDDD